MIAAFAMIAKWRIGRRTTGRSIGPACIASRVGVILIRFEFGFEFFGYDFRGEDNGFGARFRVKIVPLAVAVGFAIA